MNRKVLQFKAEGFQEIRHALLRHKQRTSILQRLVQTLWHQLMVDASIKFDRWKDFASNRSSHCSRGFSKLSYFFRLKEVKAKQEAFRTVEYYSNTIVRVIEKIEKTYLIERHKLLREILTLYCREGIERLTTTSAPGKFSRWMILKKNGYKYLGLLLRKFVKKRTVVAFDWYSSLTGVLRYACVIGRMVDRCLKQRG